MTAVCPYCAHPVPVARFPWLYRRHDIWGNAIGAQATATCIGSRNIYTLHLLGLRELEPELIPRESTAFASSHPQPVDGKVA